jgi:alanine racemase
MPDYSVQQISEIVGGKALIHKNLPVRYILIDSRKVYSADDVLFFALRGARHDGHDFIDALYDKGIRNFVVNLDHHAKFKDANYIFVEDTLPALQQVAAYHRRQYKGRVMAITGSNGKTIVKEWLSQALSKEYKISRSPRSYNSQVGVPLSVWDIDLDADIAIIEAGISQPGEMQKLEEIIKPDTGIFTNISEAHQENFIDWSEKAIEKAVLFKNAQHIIYSKEYEVIERALTRTNIVDNATSLTWSASAQADINVLSRKTQNGSTFVQINHAGRDFEIKIPFIDKASYENAMHVCAAMLLLGYEPVMIKERIAALSQVAMRMEMIKGINNCTIINDSYSSDVGSLEIALDFLAQQHQHHKKTLILSDILQSGKNEADLYRFVSELLKQKAVDRLIGIGEKMSRYKSFFNIPSAFYPTTSAFLESPGAFYDEAILLKGARMFRFERIGSHLEEKLNRTVLEINMNALVHNLNYFRSLLEPETRVMAMVKAFSYGSGTYEIAHLLQYQKVDYLGVAFADEGIALRNAGVELPIVVMNPERSSYQAMIEHGLEPEIFNINSLRAFNDILVKMGRIQPFNVHIKLDTGMNRLGLLENELDELVRTIKNMSAVRIGSVFSHLAASSEPQHDDFTRSQIALFDKMSQFISGYFDYPVMRHILNSAGTERFPQAQYDMVRLGIGLYGISAIDPANVKHISTLKSYVSQVKQVPYGQTIGYGRKGKTNRDATIAIVPIGYADGLNRLLSNGVGRFFINGQFAPIIGNVCMDMTMADITGLDVKEGDEVIVFGEMQTISYLAETLHTIPYEILTSISGRVKRIYYQE